MVEGASEAGDVGNDASADDEDRLVARNAALLQVHQHFLHVDNLFVHFVACAREENQ